MDKKAMVIPHDLEAEQAILGSIIFEPQTINKIAKHCTPNTFHLEQHRHIYRAILELANNNSLDVINEISVGDELKKMCKIDEVGGYGYLAELIECVPSSGNPEYWAVIIKQHSIMRDIISLTADIGRKGRDPQQSVMDLLQEAQDGINKISRGTKTTSSQHIKEAVKESCHQIEMLSKGENLFLGAPTGFSDIDRIISGLIPKDMIIIGGRPGTGKTTLAFNIAMFAARSGKLKGDVLYFSREMANSQLASRALSTKSKIDTRKIKTGEIENDQWECLSMAAEEISNTSIYLNDELKDINDMIFEVGRLNQELDNGIGLVLFDYLQKFQSRGFKKKYDIVSDVSGKIKDLGLDLDIPTIALCQLNRSIENRDDKTPKLSDLRESGEIEQDADIIMFISREDLYDDETERKGIADITIAKHRNGPLGAVELHFDGAHSTFNTMTKYDSDRF